MLLSSPSAFCARLPNAALAVLVELRTLRGVTVHLLGAEAWVYWTPGLEEVGGRLASVDGVVFFEGRGEHWQRHGSRLPATNVPKSDGAQLLSMLTPAAVQVAPVAVAPLRPALLRLVLDGRPRPTTALHGALDVLQTWADYAPTAQLEAVRAARCGDRALLLGRTLPFLPGAERFWGGRMLVPLGFRPEPALSEHAIREALGVEAEEILLLDVDGAEIVPAEVFEPLTRARVRLAFEEGRP